MVWSCGSGVVAARIQGRCESSVQVNVGVIGAGVIGLTAAFELAQGGQYVTVVDAGEPGHATSWAANGALTPFSDYGADAALAMLADEGLRRYPSLINHLEAVTGTRVELDGGGVLQVYLGSERHAGTAAFEQLVAAGIPVNWLSGAEARDLEPALTPEVSGAIHFTTEGRVNTRQLLSSLIQGVTTLGVRVLPRTTIVEIVSDHSHYGLVDGRGGLIGWYDAVIDCTGCGIWNSPLLHPFKIGRVRGEIIEVASDIRLNRCLYRGHSFITPRRNGSLLLGTNYEAHRPGESEDEKAIRVSSALAKLVGAQELLPEVTHGDIVSFWRSWRPTTLDHKPILGSYKSANWILALGFGGLGITVAPAVAARIAAAIAMLPDPYDELDFAWNRASLQAPLA